ncbi:MAG: hypothetical protein K2Y10_10780 [Burkholderiaceae bacterium]|nr:hypothetical protein [Burkholderiaceae bacterium]
MLPALVSDCLGTMGQWCPKALQEAAYVSQPTLAALLSATTLFERLI